MPSDVVLSELSDGTTSSEEDDVTFSQQLDTSSLNNTLYNIAPAKTYPIIFIYIIIINDIPKFIKRRDPKTKGCDQ